MNKEERGEAAPTKFQERRFDEGLSSSGEVLPILWYYGKKVYFQFFFTVIQLAKNP
jgi:hypothetical protein